MLAQADKFFPEILTWLHSLAWLTRLMLFAAMAAGPPTIRWLLKDRRATHSLSVQVRVAFRRVSVGGPSTRFNGRIAVSRKP